MALFAVLFLAPSQPAHAICGADPNFFSIPPWHYYLEGAACEGDNVNNRDGGFELADIWLIFAALFEAVIKISAIVALAYVIWGGFKYITSQGSPEGTASARRTITYALAGMAMATLASASVTLFMDIVAGGTAGSGILPGADSSNALQRVLNFVYAIGGAVAAIYVAIGTVKFATSTGDPGKAASARNTIIYALVGAVVIVGAYLLTTAVLGRLAEI